MFGWLIGETEVRATDVVGPDGKMREQSSVLHIKKCRFLEQVGGSGSNNRADLAGSTPHHKHRSRAAQRGHPTRGMLYSPYCGALPLQSMTPMCCYFLLRYLE